MSGRSSAARAVIASSKRRLHRGRLNAVLRAPRCWPTSSFPSSAIICPLYRQSEIYARQGVDISRSTLAGWVGGVSDLLSPLLDAIQKHVLAGRKLHAEDTPMPVLSPGNGKTKTGRLWTYVRDDRPAGEQVAPAVWFAYYGKLV